MKTICAVLLLFSTVPALQACAFPKAEHLKIRQDGNDVVVSTSVTSGGPGIMVMKSYEIDGQKVTLKYCLVQSAENARLQSLSTIHIEWRIKGVRLADVTFKVQGRKLNFEQSELDQLREQLNKQFRPRRRCGIAPRVNEQKESGRLIMPARLEFGLISRSEMATSSSPPARLAPLRASPRGRGTESN